MSAKSKVKCQVQGRRTNLWRPTGLNGGPLARYLQSGNNDDDYITIIIIILIILKQSTMPEYISNPLTAKM